MGMEVTYGLGGHLWAWRSLKGMEVICGRGGLLWAWRSFVGMDMEVIYGHATVFCGLGMNWACPILLPIGQVLN